MKTQIRFLKVKVKSLAAEAKIIRLEETRARGTLRQRLNEHRRGIVRTATRHNQLAYGFLRGRAYRVVERAHREPSWDEVAKLVKRFGVCRDWTTENSEEFAARQRQQEQAWQSWLADARAAIASFAKTRDQTAAASGA